MRDRVIVDSIAFARDRRELAGSLAVADLERLHDVLCDPSGEIRYDLAGSTDKDGEAALHLQVDGALSLACQRCLGPVKFRVELERTLKLVAPGKPLGDPADEPEDVEHIHAERELDVAALVEDEVLLALPMAAMHDAGQCAEPAKRAGLNDQMSPFSALNVLKRQ